MWQKGISMLFLIGGSSFLVSSFFPSWHVRWGRSGNGPPMSAAGRILFGLFFFVFAVVFAVNPSKLWGYVAFATLIGLLIGIEAVYRKDTRRHSEESDGHDFEGAQSRSAKNTIK